MDGLISVVQVMSGSLTSSPIEVAVRSHRFWLGVYLAWILIAAIASVFLTWMLWKAGNRQQEAVVAETNERTAKLEGDAIDSKAAQQRVEIQLAEARTAQAAAERSLLELQEKIKPRHVPDRAKFVEFLRKSHQGPVEVRCSAGDVEARNFAVEIDGALKEAGWQSKLNDRVIMVPQPVGLLFWIHSAESVPEHAGSLQQAFKEIDFPTGAQTNQDIQEGSFVLVVGSKP